MDNFRVVCSAGSLRPASDDRGETTHFTHRWTDGGVEVSTGFTGAHLLHVAVAACVLNDVYREAEKLGIGVDGVRVEAAGGFTEDWSSTGVHYQVEVDSPAEAESIEDLLGVVDRVAEIPRALRVGAAVVRASRS